MKGTKIMMIQLFNTLGLGPKQSSFMDDILTCHGRKSTGETHLINNGSVSLEAACAIQGA